MSSVIDVSSITFWLTLTPNRCWTNAPFGHKVAMVPNRPDPVPVIHLLNEKTIEERVWETRRPNKSLFASSDRIGLRSKKAGDSPREGTNKVMYISHTSQGHS